MIRAASARAGWILATVVVVQSLVSLDLALINIALPAIREDLGLGERELNWVVVAYLLVYGGFLILGGRLGDLVGRRRVLIASLALFTAASVVGGLATGAVTLVGARALQGLGAAGAAPVALALVAAHFPEGPIRSRALGLWAAATVAGGAVGVVLSGVLTDTFGWRAVMLVNVPIAVAAMLSALRLPADEAAPRGRPDVAGAVLVTGGMAALIVGVANTGSVGWAAPSTSAFLVAGLLMLVAFAVVERRAGDPVIRLGLFAHRAVLGANIFGFMITAGQLAAFFFVSLHLQEVLGYSPIAAGIAFLPFCLGSVIGMMIASRTLPKAGPRFILVTGGVVGALGIAGFGFGDPGGTFLADILVPSLPASIGIGASFVAMGGAATTGVPAAEAGMVSGLLSSFRLIGGSLGLAVLGTVAAAVTNAAPGEVPDVHALSAGYSVGLFVAAGLILLGSLFCLIIPRPAVASGEQADPEPAERAAESPR